MSGVELVAVAGADALEYLQGQVTQDLKDLRAGERTRTLVLDPDGTLVAFAAVRLDAPDAICLEVPAGVASALQARLERFAIRADVGFEVAVADAGGAGDAGLRSELARIDAGIPGRAELDAALVTQSLEPSLVAQCVSFTKGCYPGQELVARMHSRNATPPYVLRRLTVDEPVVAGAPAGDPSFEGRVTSVVEGGDGTWHALCVLHRRDATSHAVDVHLPSGPARAMLR